MTIDDTTPPSDQTRIAATQRAPLDLGKIALLGTLTGGLQPRALLRLAGGRIVTLEVGGRVGRHRLQEVSEGAVSLKRGTRTMELAIPGKEMSGAKADGTVGGAPLRAAQTASDRRHASSSASQ